MLEAQKIAEEEAKRKEEERRKQIEEEERLAAEEEERRAEQKRIKKEKEAVNIYCLVDYMDIFLYTYILMIIYTLGQERTIA